MDWPKRLVLKRLEQTVVVVIIAAVAAIHFLTDHKLVVLNFFYVPVLAVAFFFGRRLGALTVLLCFLLVVASALISPHAYDIQVTPQLLALDLTIWGGFLALAALLVGGLSEWRRRQLQQAPSTRHGRPHHSERRRFLRVKTELPVRYWYLDESGEPLKAGPWEGVAYNISKTGIELTAEVPPEEVLPKVLLQLAPIYVEISLPNVPEPVGAVTRVIWVEPRTVKPPRYRMGLEIREITRTDEDKIVDYIINERVRAEPVPRSKPTRIAAS